jgi:predicted transcriptional regulator
MTIFIILVLMLLLNWWTVQRTKERIMKGAVTAARIVAIEIAKAIENGHGELVENNGRTEFRLTDEGRKAVVDRFYADKESL